jgi:hypothetical protein
MKSQQIHQLFIQLHLLVFHVYINKMHGSRSKISSKNLVGQRCVEGFNSRVKRLKYYLLRNYEVNNAGSVV